MSKVLRLEGIIRDINYDPQVRTVPLEQFGLDGFDINSAAVSGIIEFPDDTSFGYSKWRSPKPSSNLPFGGHLQDLSLTDEKSYCHSGSQG